MSKRKRVVSSHKDKLKKLKGGHKLTTKNGEGTSTISKKNSNSILKYTCKLKGEDHKMTKSQNNKQLEKALHSWFLKKQSTGQIISGPILCEKGLQVNRKVGGDESFAASNDWLCRFKSHHGIRKLETKGEKMSDDAVAANSNKGQVQERSDEDKEAGPSHVEALQALEIAVKWFGKQPECNTVGLSQLHRLRDLAALKRKISLRQMRITNYFNVK